MRIRQLDGLRALAILAVVIHHHEIVHGGWIGVDLFFVLSGYLITKGLRKERTSQNFWRSFYTKRATRILPAALAALVFDWVVFRPPILHILLYAAFLGNVANVLHRVMIVSLFPFWSLAVEEHFYLLFPVAVRRYSRRTLITLLLTILLVEPVLRILGTGVHGFLVIYFLTPFRLDGLACGALLALATEREDVVVHLKRFSGAAALAFMAIFAILSATFPAQFDREVNSRFFNGLGYTLLAGWFAFTVAFVLFRPEALFTRVLKWRPLVFIGTISYGLYLYHQFVHYFVGLYFGAFNSARTFALSFTLSIAIAWLSFRYFESPITRWGHERAKQHKESANESQQRVVHVSR